jgi:hypothetical protein
MKRIAPLLALLLWAGASSAPAAAEEGGFPETAAFVPARVLGQRDGAPLYRAELLSPVYQVDRLYGSMRGPMTSQYFTLDHALGREGQPPELLWLTGYRAVMMEPDGVTQTSQEFMCHSNFDLDLTNWRLHFPTDLTFRDGRVFTLAQGQLGMRLPPGFAIPLMSNSPLGLDTQVLNHNVVGPPFGVRHRVQLEFQRDAELEQRPVPLVQRSVFGMALVKGPDGVFGVDPVEVDPEEHGPGCLPAPDAGGPLHHARDEHGRVFTSFWVVPPGRQVNHTRVTEQLRLPYDTTIHYIAVHVHPYAESLTLTDRTTGKTVFHSKVRQVEKGTGLAEVDALTSRDGLPIYAGHEYELTSVYDNPTDRNGDAMAVMYLYLRARDLEQALRRETAAP